MSKFKELPLSVADSTDRFKKFKLEDGKDYRVHIIPQFSKMKIGIHYVKGIGYIACNSDDETGIAKCCNLLNGTQGTRLKHYFPLFLINYATSDLVESVDEIHSSMINSKDLVSYWLCPTTRRDAVAKAIERSGRPIESVDLLINANGNNFTAVAASDNICIKDADILKKKFEKAFETAKEMFESLEKKCGVLFLSDDEIEKRIARLETVSITNVVSDEEMNKLLGEGDGEEKPKPQKKEQVAEQKSVDAPKSSSNSKDTSPQKSQPSVKESKTTVTEQDEDDDFSSDIDDFLA